MMRLAGTRRRKRDACSDARAAYRVAIWARASAKIFGAIDGDHLGHHPARRCEELLSDGEMPTKSRFRLRLCENPLMGRHLAHGLHACDHMEVTYAQIHRGTR